MPAGIVIHSTLIWTNRLTQSFWSTFFQHYLFKTKTHLLWSQREFSSECQHLCYFILWLPKQELPIIPYYTVILLGIQSCFHEVETSYHLPLLATELGAFSKPPHSLRVSFLGRHNSKHQTILPSKKPQSIILSCIYSIKLLSARLFFDISPSFRTYFWIPKPVKNKHWKILSYIVLQK